MLRGIFIIQEKVKSYDSFLLFPRSLSVAHSSVISFLPISISIPMQHTLLFRLLWSLGEITSSQGPATLLEASGWNRQ
jgi:hypothetical protein